MSTLYNEEHLHHAKPLEHYADATQGQGMHPGWLLVIALAVGFVCYILFDGMKSETYFYEVDKAVAQGSALVGKTIRIKGKVEEGSVVGEAGQLERTFSIAERGKSLRVRYTKALPDTFKEGMEVVAQGKVDHHYVMQADEVLVKCPSRYEGGAPTKNESAKNMVR